MLWLKDHPLPPWDPPGWWAEPQPGGALPAGQVLAAQHGAEHWTHPHTHTDRHTHTQSGWPPWLCDLGNVPGSHSTETLRKHRHTQSRSRRRRRPPRTHHPILSALSPRLPRPTLHVLHHGQGHRPAHPGFQGWTCPRESSRIYLGHGFVFYKLEIRPVPFPGLVLRPQEARRIKSTRHKVSA